MKTYRATVQTGASKHITIKLEARNLKEAISLAAQEGTVRSIIEPEELRQELNRILVARFPKGGYNDRY